MHSLDSLSLDIQYRTGESDPVESFYIPCLKQSKTYDRAVGYFRSSVFLIVGCDVLNFCKSGGKIRLVCSPSLEAQDVKTISESDMSQALQMSDALLFDLKKLLNEDSSKYRTQVLGTLLKIGALDIRIAIRPESTGQYHEKVGLFGDEIGNYVSFMGSSNETWSGWHYHGNHEAIEVFCSWKGAGEAVRVERHRAYFQRLWDNQVGGVKVIDFPEAVKSELIKQSFDDLDDIDYQKICLPDFEQKTQAQRNPLKHQIEALDAWKKNGYSGILQHATGSGKTFTAIIEIKKYLKTGKPVLVLVPSTLLLGQWSEELATECSNTPVLLCGAGNSRWKKDYRLKSFSADLKTEFGRIIIATMQTASSAEFIAALSQGSHIFLVADEVHQLGSPKNANFLTVNCGPKLGLSATPTRYGDVEGTKYLLNYFGGIIQPPYTLSDAIKDNRLVNYKYYPRVIYLTQSEADDWSVLTKKIRFELAISADKDGIALTEKAKLLLIRRSRIAKKAIRKIAEAKKILIENYKKGQRWLIYCEDNEQLATLSQSLREDGFSPLEYHMNMDGDKIATLDFFKSFGGILLSIKCLDEGVDIPSIDHAIILASSQNPRQFIQRRGRVLRKFKDKRFAVIFDTIVSPENVEEEEDQLSLLKAELTRAIEFSKSAMNKSAENELLGIATNAGIDIETLRDVGLEEDED